MRLELLAAAVLALGCGERTGTPPPPSDAAVDAGEIDRSVRSAAAVALPDFEPCPTGWSPTVLPQLPSRAICDPWPVTPEPCSGVETRTLGADRCAPIGDPCAVDEFPDPPAGATVLYVRAGGGAGGTGTLADPFTDLASATAAAPDGATLLLGAGEHRARLTVASTLTLLGACPERTRLVADGSSSDYFVTVLGDLTLRGLRVEAAGDGLLVESGGRLQVDGVAFVDVFGQAIAVLGSAEIDRSLFRIDAASAPAAATAVIQEGGDVTVRRSVLRGYPDGALLSSGDGTTLRVEDSVLGATQLDAETFVGGRAIQVAAGAEATIARVAFDLPGRAALFAEAASVVLQDVYVEELRSLDGVAAAAIIALAGATVTVDGLVVDGAEGSGLRATDPGTVLTIRDALVLDTYGLHVDGGYAVEASAGARIVLERVVFEQTERAGIALVGASGELTDVVVRNTFASPGVGVMAFDGSSLTAERLALERNGGAGLAVASSPATITDLVVDDTAADGESGIPGFGVIVTDGAVVTIERTSMRGNHNVSLSAFDPATTVDVRDAHVVATRAVLCEGEGCPTGEAGGIGVGAYGGASLTMTRFLLDEHALAAAQVAFGSPDGLEPYPDGGRLVLSAGVVRSNPVGVSVQVEGYDFDLLTSGVLYEENGRNLDSTLAPTPRPPTIDF